MPIIINSPTDQTKFDIVDGIITAVGRPVTLTVHDSFGPCYTCSGTNPFCLTCSGQPNLEYTHTVDIIATVRWGPSEKKMYTPAGQYIEGDCKIVFSLTSSGEFITTDQLLQKTQKITIDNRECVIDKWYFKGQPINRCYVICNEDRNLSGSRI